MDKLTATELKLRTTAIALGVANLREKVAKNNPCHNQSDGKFCSTGGGGEIAPKEKPPNPNKMDRKQLINEIEERMDKLGIGGWDSSDFEDLGVRELRSSVRQLRAGYME